MVRLVIESWVSSTQQRQVAHRCLSHCSFYHNRGFPTLRKVREGWEATAQAEFLLVAVAVVIHIGGSGGCMALRADVDSVIGQGG
jgi:hypothetical protein